MAISFDEETPGLLVANDADAVWSDHATQAKRLRLLEMIESIAGLGYWRYDLTGRTRSMAFTASIAPPSPPRLRPSGISSTPPIVCGSNRRCAMRR